MAEMKKASAMKLKMKKSMAKLKKTNMKETPVPGGKRKMKPLTGKLTKKTKKVGPAKMKKKSAMKASQQMGAVVRRERHMI
jgi:hypothetical protein